MREQVLALIVPSGFWTCLCRSTKTSDQKLPQEDPQKNLFTKLPHAPSSMTISTPQDCTQISAGRDRSFSSILMSSQKSEKPAHWTLQQKAIVTHTLKIETPGRRKENCRRLRKPRNQRNSYDRENQAADDEHVTEVCFCKTGWRKMNFYP